MKIPKTFTLGGIKYQVMLVNHIDKGETLGLSDADEGWIKIMRGLPRQRLEHTYCHELVHCLLQAAGRDDLSTDETLVDVFSAFLHQHNITQKGNL